MDKLKIEIVIIVFSIMLLFGLAVRADLETDIRFRESEIVNLEAQVKGKIDQIKDLQEQLQPPEYAQPLEKIIVSSITGIRVNPMGGGSEGLHKGIDLVEKVGTPVKSVLAGKVVEHWLPPGWHYGTYYRGHDLYGGCIIIDHGDQLFTTYGHLSKTSVHEDQYVQVGEKIGEVGSTGPSTGPHLHLELTINPFKYLSERRR